MQCLDLSILWLVKEGNAKFRRIDDPVREMTGMFGVAVVEEMRELTGQIRREHGMRATTVESGPTISRIGDMDMEEWSHANPNNQPNRNQ